MSDPYKVLLVDDEPIMIQGVTRFIQEMKGQYAIAGSAHNGQLALKMLAELKPDFLITDIRMPIMDGLELIESAAKLTHKPQIIITSGYEDFNYARQAIRLGVGEYLLKPITMVNLKSALSKLAQRLEENRHRVRREMIVSALFSSEQIDEMLSHDNVFNIGIIRTSAVLKLEVAGFSGVSKPEETFIHKGYEQGDFFVVSPIDTVRDFTAFIKDMQAILKDKSNIISAACACQGPVKLNNLREKAQELTDYLSGNAKPWNNDVISPGDIIENSGVPSVTRQDLDPLLQYVHANKPETFQNALRELLTSIAGFGATQANIIHCIRRVVTQLVMASVTESDSQALEEASVAALKNSASLDAFLDDICKLLTSAVFRSDKLKSAANDTATEVEQYLREYYSEQISINGLARQFYITPPYLIRLFKRVYGQPPINYLIKLRIERSKHILSEHPDMEFKRIAELVGYPDANYFSKLFKKSTGYTLSDYKESLKKK